MSSAEQNLNKNDSFHGEISKLSHPGIDLGVLFNAEFESNRISLLSARARINLICDSSGERIYAIECFPKNFNGAIPNFGYRIFNFPVELEEIFLPKSFNNLGDKDPLLHIAENLSKRMIIEKFHLDRSREGSKLIEKYFGNVSIRTEPLGTFEEFLNGTVLGSRTIVERNFNYQPSSILTVSFNYLEEGRLVRKIEIDADGRMRKPQTHFILTENDQANKNLMLTTDRAILLFANYGVSKIEEYLSLDYLQQILIAQQPDDPLRDLCPAQLVDDIFQAYHHSNLIHANRIAGVGTEETRRSFKSQEKNEDTNQKIRSQFLTGQPSKIVETNDGESAPFIARYNSTVGPISITLSSESNSPGVFIGKHKAFLTPPFSTKFVSESFRDLTSTQISTRIDALKKLVAFGYTIEIAKNSLDLDLIKEIKDRVLERFKDKIVGTLNGTQDELTWRNPASSIELLDAALNYLRGRQSIVIANYRKADQSFTNMTLSLDQSGNGTIQMVSRFGVNLQFEFQPVTSDYYDQHKKFLIDLVDDFSISPALVVERLFRTTHLVEDRSIWTPGGDLKWGQDPSNWHYRINPKAAKTYHYISALYELNLEDQFGIKLKPFSEIVDPFIATLPETIDIRISSNQGLTLEYKFSDEGLIGVSLLAPRKGLFGLFGAMERCHSVNLMPSDDFRLARARGVIHDTLGMLVTMRKEQIANIKEAPLLRHLDYLSHRIVG